jgi:hypothetical protein
MDPSPLGLVPNAKAAESITNTVYRRHEEIEMESLPESKTTPTKVKLFGSAIDSRREKGQDTIQSWHRITSNSLRETEK